MAKKVESEKISSNKKIVQKVQGAVERNEDLIQDSVEYMIGEEYKNLVKKNQLV